MKRILMCLGILSLTLGCESLVSEEPVVEAQGSDRTSVQNDDGLCIEDYHFGPFFEDFKSAIEDVTPTCEEGANSDDTDCERAEELLDRILDVGLSHGEDVGLCYLGWDDDPCLPRPVRDRPVGLDEDGIRLKWDADASADLDIDLEDFTGEDARYLEWCCYVEGSFEGQTSTNQVTTYVKCEFYAGVDGTEDPRDTRGRVRLDTTLDIYSNADDYGSFEFEMGAFYEYEDSPGSDNDFERKGLGFSGTWGF